MSKYAVGVWVKFNEKSFQNGHTGVIVEILRPANPIYKVMINKGDTSQTAGHTAMDLDDVATIVPNPGAIAVTIAVAREFKAGDSVRFNEGGLAGMTAEVIAVNSEHPDVYVDVRLEDNGRATRTMAYMRRRASIIEPKTEPLTYGDHW